MGRQTTILAILSGLTAIVLSSSFGAHAKQTDARGELTIEVVFAVHLPTGCLASVKYDDGTVIEAFLTDPLCLPEGIERRAIPAKAVDFDILPFAGAPPVVW